MAQLLGADGKPIPVAQADLSREVAPPTPWAQMGLRTIWHGPLARGLTPANLAQLLDSAAQGNAHQFLTLAEEMEERDPHYAAVLGTRKRAVLGLSRKVESASDKLRDRKIADEVRDLVAAAAFGRLLPALLDALGKGYSAVEIGWDTTGSPWLPTRYQWRDPRWFLIDLNDGQTLRILDIADPVYGLPLPPARFIVHIPRLKMGLPIRGGLARLAAIASLCKHQVLENWLMFAESYGAPVRILNADDQLFSSGASAEQQALLQSLQDKLQTMLGADAYAVLPKSVTATLQQAARGGSDVHEPLAVYLQALISKAVLGRSDAADATDGRLGSPQDSMEVRQDILESDAEELADCINQQLVRPFVELNFGVQADLPRFQFHLPEKDDLALLATALKDLIPLGLKVEQSVIRDKFNLPDPEDRAELLSAPAVSAMPASPTLNHALNRAILDAPTPDPTDPLVDRLGKEADPLINTLLDPVRAALDASSDLMDFREKLLTLYPDLDGKAFADLMGQALAVADAMGQWEARPHGG
jgi:phage gp29-like protein